MTWIFHKTTTPKSFPFSIYSLSPESLQAAIDSKVSVDVTFLITTYTMEPSNSVSISGRQPSQASGNALQDYLLKNIPPSDVPKCIEALKHATDVLHPAILNHSSRVFLYAEKLAQQTNPDLTSPERITLLFVSCILHDIGTCSEHNHSEERFEVEGADFAASLLRRHGVPEADIREVWIAIALHSTAGIAERISELARIVRTAVLIDFGKKVTDPEIEALVKKTEEQLPRLQAEKILADAVVEQALERPQKAPAASWPGCLLRARIENPDWTGINPAF